MRDVFLKIFKHTSNFAWFQTDLDSGRCVGSVVPCAPGRGQAPRRHQHAATLYQQRCCAGQTLAQAFIRVGLYSTVTYAHLPREVTAPTLTTHCPSRSSYFPRSRDPSSIPSTLVYLACFLPASYSLTVPSIPGVGYSLEQCLAWRTHSTKIC